MNAYAIPGMIVTRRMVERAACNVMKIPIEELYTRTRFQEFVWARHMVFYFLRKKQKQGPNQIIRNTSFDHATVVHSVKTVKNFKDTNDPEFMPLFNEFMGKLGRKYVNQ